MKKLSLISAAAVIWTLALAAASASATIPLRLVDLAGYPKHKLALAEHAIVGQSYVLRRYWGTPLVRFSAAYGYPIWLETRAQRIRHGEKPPFDPAFHSFESDPETFAFGIVTAGDWRKTSARIDRVVAEMLVDPYYSTTVGGALAEICRPVTSDQYRSSGAWLNDFVFRRWYLDGRAPYDLMHALRSPRR